MSSPLPVDHLPDAGAAGSAATVIESAAAPRNAVGEWETSGDGVRVFVRRDFRVAVTQDILDKLAADRASFEAKINAG